MNRNDGHPERRECRGPRHPHFDSIDDKLFHQIVHCSHMLSRGHGPGAGRSPEGPERGMGQLMKPGQRRVLEQLANAETLTQSQLRERLDIRAASLSELLGKLESRGLIYREKSKADKRSIDVSITDLGKDALEESRQLQKEMTARLLAGLDDAEKEQLSELLGKLMHGWRDAAHRGHGRPCGPKGRRDRGEGHAPKPCGERGGMREHDEDSDYEGGGDHDQNR